MHSSVKGRQAERVAPARLRRGGVPRTDHAVIVPELACCARGVARCPDGTVVEDASTPDRASVRVMGDVFLQGGSHDGQVHDDGGLPPAEVLVLPKRGTKQEPAEVELYAGSQLEHVTSAGERLPVRVCIGARPAG